MKEMNRREFLALSGASVALLALAACGSTPSTPAAPAGSKEAELVAAINKVWKEKHDAGAVVHEQLTLNQDAVGAIMQGLHKTVFAKSSRNGEDLA